MQPSDASLISRVLLNDDHHAFSELVRRNQSAVRGLLRRLTHGDHALADDLAQEAFIKAYKNLPKLRDASRFRSWLYQIAYRLFLSHIRKTKHFEHENPSLEPADTDTRRAVSLSQDIESALQHLTEKECATIHLAYMEGCTHVEIAEILDLPHGSVKTILLRAKSKLEKYLKDWKD